MLLTNLPVVILMYLLLITLTFPLMVFIFYSDEVTINVTNGLVTRHKN